jgi:hypothetical protein
MNTLIALTIILIFMSTTHNSINIKKAHGHIQIYAKTFKKM